MKIKGFDDTIAWYNQNAKQYARANAAIADLDQIEEFSRLIPSKAAVLDAGCAAGRDSNLLSQRGFVVTGIDISSGLIAIARKTFPKIEFIEGSFLSLPMEAERFNGVWAHQSLLHLETPQDVATALGEFNRVLKPGGVLLILVKAQTGTDKTAVVGDSLSGHDRFFQYFTKEEVEGLLTQAGFSLIRIEQYGEASKNPRGRAEVELILTLGRKE